MPRRWRTLKRGLISILDVETNLFFETVKQKMVGEIKYLNGKKLHISQSLDCTAEPQGELVT